MEYCMEDWPEPIINVQSIAESGDTIVPYRYIKPPSHRPEILKSTPQEQTIPVINLAGLEGDEHACNATMHEISVACKEWGFFQIVNHGVRPELMERTRQVWRDFFHLPMEEKIKYANTPKTYEGYGSRLGIEKGAILDWGDYFFLNLLPLSLKNHNKWPCLPETLRETVEECGGEVVKFCEKVMKMVSKSLGLEEEYMKRVFGGYGDEGVGVTMRANYYPRCPQPELTLGLSPHSDPGGVTVLLADERVQGLQVHKDGAWVTVQPLPHAFIVNLGDQIQMVSNAIYKSVEHRVMVNSEEERVSIAFFYNPRGDMLIGPAKELVTPARPAFCKPVTWNEYRLILRKQGLHGKAQVDSLKPS
ncbi:probable 2-oxoglutarate-dependent dioxygenase At5g05600 [Dioscorea cayenensis subsp. rotundata]|uniref:Probable 2-oxoglutarate-dependent dioxygenase At5g05600 n=1 Tax=Dioscorea cayennensis subsp. rotundata TaxID=55577 RepID=A0AB40CBK9_DIOCR|nr:probable 2-oxoglutarate-dependent dioxygenase At5g05600 [Dioscorea cayenensis subsp. rotundata]